MKPIYGRRCENCGGKLNPYMKRGARFCGASCRSEAARVRHGGKPRRSVHTKPQRGDTSYAVFQVVRAEAGLLADLELVGHHRCRKRERAIERVAAGLSPPWPDGVQFVAVPIRALDPYYADGEKVKEVPGYAIP